MGVCVLWLLHKADRRQMHLLVSETPAEERKVGASKSRIVSSYLEEDHCYAQLTAMGKVKVCSGTQNL